jgi:hypothetical protein
MQKGKIVVLFILIFKFLGWNGKTGEAEEKGKKNSPSLICP